MELPACRRHRPEAARAYIQLVYNFGFDLRIFGADSGTDGRTVRPCADCPGTLSFFVSYDDGKIRSYEYIRQRNGAGKNKNARNKKYPGLANAFGIRRRAYKNAAHLSYTAYIIDNGHDKYNFDDHGDVFFSVYHAEFKYPGNISWILSDRSRGGHAHIYFYRPAPRRRAAVSDPDGRGACAVYNLAVRFIIYSAVKLYFFDDRDIFGSVRICACHAEKRFAFGYIYRYTGESAYAQPCICRDDRADLAVRLACRDIIRI